MAGCVADSSCADGCFRLRRDHNTLVQSDGAQHRDDRRTDPGRNNGCPRKRRQRPPIQRQRLRRRCPAQESSETTAAETTAVSQSAGDTSAYEETAERLFGALDYIDQIGAGNLPKDESDTIRSTGSGAVYEKVAKTQFSSTADLKAYMESSLTQKMIDSRYAAILGTDQPLYIDANGSLYGRQFATSGGFSWTSGKAEVSDLSDSAFTASMQYDDFGASATLTAQIVLENGQWKIDSIQQTN